MADRNARGQFWGIMRCERLSKDSMSLHSEGRAIDWHLDVSRAADRRAARRLILTLLATDRAGNPHALARRMGVQEIIWNCRSWWSGADRMGPYSLCYTRKGKLRRKVDRTLAHRDHVHIGLSRTGRADAHQLLAPLVPWPGHEPRSSHPSTGSGSRSTAACASARATAWTRRPGVFELDHEDKAVVIDPDGDPWTWSWTRRATAP